MTDDYVDQAVLELRTAFAHRYIPRIVTQTIDPTLGADDAAWFTGRSSDGLSHDDWRGREGALRAFTPDAFCYYLPALLEVAIKGQGFPTIVRALLAMLDAPDLGTWGHWHRQMFGQLTHAEYSAIWKALKLLSYTDDIGDECVRPAQRTMMVAEAYTYRAFEEIAAAMTSIIAKIPR